MKQLKTTTKSGEYLLVESESQVDAIAFAYDFNKPESLGQLSGISGDLKSEILEGIRKEGWYTKPLPKPKRYTPFMGPGQYTQNDLDEIEEHNKEMQEWEEKLTRTLDPDKTYCFKILK